MRVEVIYCAPNAQTLLDLEVIDTCTVGEAIAQSKILKGHDLCLDSLSVGIFSKRCTLNTAIKVGDRIELYRHLLLNPTEARRLRAITQANKSK